MTEDGIFKSLRPFCVKVAENPSVESLSILKQELEKSSFQQLQPIQEYILFPIKLAFLRENRKENETIALVNCLTSFLSLTEIQNWEIFSDLFLKLFSLISYPDQEIKVLNGKEDLKIAVVSCVKMLVEHSHESVKKLIYGSSFCPILGHGVFVLLRLSELESLRSLQILSVQTIRILFGLTDWSSKFLPNSDQLSAMDRLASFLPGICMTMTKVASGDQKQGQELTVEALETWACVVVSCLHILEEQEAVQENNIKFQENPLEVCRTQDWILATASNLQILLKRILPLVSHPHHKVRLAVIDWARMLLMHCRSPFQDSLVDILECVISLTHDESEDVALKSRDLMSHLSQQDLSKPLIDTLEDSVYALATRLPRLLHNSDEKQKLVSLNLLSGYFTLLGDRIGSLLHSSPHLKRLSQSLLHVAEIDTKHLPLVMPLVGTPSSKSLEFQHFQEKMILSSLKQVCKLLGLNGDLCLLVDCFLETARTSACNREGAILIINLIVDGSSLNVDNQDMLDTVRHLLEVYQSPWLWNNEKAFILKGLLLEGLALFSKILGEKADLRDLLCILLEQAGANSDWVVHSGQTALKSLASSCRYKSVDDMISSNADYLLHNLSFKLLHFTEYPDLPGLLNVLFSTSNEEMIILFEDVIYQILTNVDACYGDSKALSYLLVLRNLLNTVQKWPCSQEVTNKTTQDVRTPETSESLRDFFLQHHANVLASRCPEAEEMLDECHSENGDLLPEDEANPVESEPLHLKMTYQILEHCFHYMRSSEIQTILVSLDIVQLGLNILCPHENKLLPMVHLLWNPFQGLFQDSNQVIISKAFETLLQIASLCKTFIHKRTVDGVWPSLLSYLRKRLYQGNDRHYPSQNTYKLQLLLLSKLGDLAVQLELEGNPLNNLCQLCLLYLETDQPVEIKKACANTLSVVKQLDSDAVWWWLTRSTCLSANFPRLPGQEFRRVRLPNVNRFPDLSVSIMHNILESNII